MLCWPGVQQPSPCEYMHTSKGNCHSLILCKLIYTDMPSRRWHRLLPRHPVSHRGVRYRLSSDGGPCLDISSPSHLPLPLPFSLFYLSLHPVSILLLFRFSFLSFPPVVLSLFSPHLSLPYFISFFKYVSSSLFPSSLLFFFLSVLLLTAPFLSHLKKMEGKDRRKWRREKTKRLIDKKER